jgi:hypothetical protein
MRSYRRWIVTLLGAGLIVHGSVLFAAHWNTGTIDGYALRSLDCGEYYAIARNLVEHGAFSQSETPPFVPDTWRTPGYPLFLAAIMLVVGKSPVALVLVQQVLAVVNVLLVFHVARKKMSDSRAALAAILFLLEPYHLFYSLWLLSTTWLVTLILLTWLAWSKAIASAESWRFALLGGLCGFLVLTWPGAILVPVATAMGILISRLLRRPRRKPTACAAGIVIFLAVCSGVVASWMVRTQRAAGKLALSHQSGIVLAYFKASEVVLWREGRTEDRYLETSLSPDRRDQSHPTWETIDETLRLHLYDLPIEQQKQLTWSNLAQGNKTSVDSFRISAELESIAQEYLLESPLSTLAWCLARCGSILTFPLDLAVWPPKGVEVNRLRSAALGVVYFLLVLGVVVRLARRRIGFQAVYFPLACTLALLLATTPQTDPRFRVPLIALLIFVALLPVVSTNPPSADERWCEQFVRATREDRTADRPASTTGEPDRQKGPC